MKITKVVGRQVFDSRGNPTVEAEVYLNDKTKASAIVPSGASTGAHEAYELRDGNKDYFLGKSVLKAVKNINTVINKNLKKINVDNQKRIDQILLNLDGTDNKKKLEESGNKNIMLTERGASFGYNTLVSDMRSLPIMAKFGYPIVFDATHSVQQPGGMGEKSGGQREFVPYLSRAAIAVGVGAVFMETHEDPDNAPSDGPNMVPLSEIKSLLKQLVSIDTLIKN